LANHWDHPMFVPIIVNSAFSLELYLKCLIHIERDEFPKWTQTHLLMSKLFKGLTKTHKIKIRGLYDQAWDELWRKYPKDRTPQPFRKAMKVSDDAFDSWRYLHEYPRKRRQYGGAPIIPHVREVICQEMPELRDFLGKPGSRKKTGN